MSTFSQIQMNLVTNLNDTGAKYTKIMANTHEYPDKPKIHRWQIHMKMIANKHELSFIYFPYKFRSKYSYQLLRNKL